MTAMTRRPTYATAASGIGELRMLKGLHTGAAVGLDQHRHLHGAMPRLDLRQLIAACGAVRLTGRGGAGFPVAQKLTSLRRGRRTVLVNGTESEPASHKDRLLLNRFPHLVLDGALLVADAIGAPEVCIAVHDQRTSAGLAWALGERSDRHRFTAQVVAGGFVSGEARALVRALNGGPPVPPGRRALPSDHGVGGAATFLSNAETFAHVAVLASLGPAAYAAVGTRDEPGTTLVSVGGAVARPGVLEIPIGTSLDAVLSAAGARPAAGIIVGGYHGAWISPRPDLALSRSGLNGAGGTLGAGVILVVDDTTCALGELTRVASWLANESARQCGPCMFGLPALVGDLASLSRGGADAEYALRRHAGLVTGRGACAHPDGAARFITSGIAALHSEVATHRRRGNCGRTILGQLPINDTSWR